MQLIKVKIIKNGAASPRTYVYKSSDDIQVNDVVKVPVGKNEARAIVVEVGVSEADAGYPVSGIKEIIGKASMTIPEIIEKMFDEKVSCKYCLHDDECPHGMACYGGEPIEPICANQTNQESILDYETYADENKIKIIESEEK